MSAPVCIQPYIGHTCNCSMFLWINASIGTTGNSTSLSFLVGITFQAFFPHGRQKNQMNRLSQIFLGYLKFRHDRCFFHRSEKRTERFTRLKIDRPVFNLNYNIITKLTIKWHKFSVSLFGTIRISQGCIQKHATSQYLQKV